VAYVVSERDARRTQMLQRRAHPIYVAAVHHNAPTLLGVPLVQTLQLCDASYRSSFTAAAAALANASRRIALSAGATLA
jgi:hypothetical protein